MPALGAVAAERFATLALKCLHDEYPNHISLHLEADADALPPHRLTPAFYGCYDWHSDVHGHWLLARLLRLYPQAPYAARARAELARTFTTENIAGEIAFMQTPGPRLVRAAVRAGLGADAGRGTARVEDPQAAAWLATLQPLEAEVATRVKAWLPKLHYPIRVGEHDQTAFSFGLIWDWAGMRATPRCAPRSPTPRSASTRTTPTVR